MIWGLLGVMYMCRRPIVRNSLYARDNRASACTMNGCRCMKCVRSIDSSISRRLSVDAIISTPGDLKGICFSFSRSASLSSEFSYSTSRGSSGSNMETLCVSILSRMFLVMEP